MIYGGSELLKKAYPTINIDDIEAVIEEIDVNKDGRIEIDEFIGFMHSSSGALGISKNSPQYRAILALKAQRRFLPNDFMNYFEKISASALYVPSFLSTLHGQFKNLPSESFRLVRDPSGIGYMDIRPTLDRDGKPTKLIQEIQPYLSGYIVLNSASGVPIPDPLVMKRENIVSRTIKISFFDTKSNKFVYGSAFVLAAWDPGAEDMWTFNSAQGTGTNPVVFKWVDKATVPQIAVIFEFVSSIKYHLFLLNSP